MRRKSYSEEQLNILKKYYPTGDWDNILSAFPDKNRETIGAIARNNGIRRTKNNKRDLNIAGNKYGLLTAVRRSDVDKWICKCDCGKDSIVPIYALLEGRIKSCGCLRHVPAKNAKDFTGQIFGMLKAVERLTNYNGTGETSYRCICDCGTEKIVKSGNLRSGHTRSCGGKVHTRKDFEILNYELDSSEKTYYIYKHTSPSGKVYIGITKQKPERRFRNGDGYKTQKAFYRAIEKYGWESFKHEIIEEGLTEKEAYEKEAYYIEKVYNSFAPNGYNTREGGIHARVLITPVIQYYHGKPVNYFEGMKQAVKKLGICAATIKKHSGEENAIEGYYFEIYPKIKPYKVDVDLRELNDIKHYCVKDIVENKWKTGTINRIKSLTKQVNKYSLDGKFIETFSSIKDASRSIEGSTEEAIYAAINPKRQGETAYGFMWRYDNGDYSDISAVVRKNWKKIVQIDKRTGKVIKVYQSMSGVAKDLKVSMYKIRVACNGKDSFDDFVLKYE